MFDMATYLTERRKLIERALDAVLPPLSARPRNLHRAMRRSVLCGGKRLRAVMCLASAEASGGSANRAILPAAAVELLHAYTLIHDDLPCMDDDDTRRGKPSCHVVFGPALAILAGDALQALAFETAARCIPPPPYRPDAIVAELARAAGSRGVVGGQVDDLSADPRRATPRMLRSIHARKTAALFIAAVRMGAISAGASPAQLNALTSYAANFGLAFQIADDLADQGPSPKKRKRALDNSSCLLVYAASEARRLAEMLLSKAVRALAVLPGGQSRPLVELAGLVQSKLD